ncbi:unnamed protein product [Schistosoma rodhaini]|uniref:SH3 domain-containing protein n=1 Tax=Schistosoma rodhaini TaxID=6188 RepID=A0AA85FW72_9TREM|nr:unnamed protein product [Schistosoma rodhaini]
MVDQRNPGNMSYECQMEKTLQKLHDVNQLRQKLLLERATLKSQLDKLLQRSVNDVDLIGGDEDDDYDNDGGDGDSGGGNGGGVGQTQSDNCQLHETEDFKSKDTVKQIRSKIKELEKRCALQLLKHEEILLEIEDVRKRSFNHSNINHNHNNNSSIITTINTIKNQLNDIDSINQLSSSTSCLINNQNQNQNNQNNKIYGRLLQSGQQQQQQQQQHQHKLKQDDIQSTYEMDSLLFDSSAMGIIELDKQMTTNTTNKQVKGRLFRSNTDLQITEGDDPNLVELFQVIEESRKSTDVPAPRMITLERQLFQSVLISWKSPELNENKIVSAYHIYVDGQFRLAVMAKEKTRALIDNVDADKPHRISIRSISSHGQSKDAQCTLVVGRGMTATPARLKATQIGTKSAKLSWIPGNSNYYHRVYLNETSLHVCKPGVYKLHLTDLPPDTLHQVCVQALPSPISIQESAQQSPPWINTACSGVYTQKLAAFIEFRTLPIGLPDPPSHVQIEAGPQDGMLLITWLPVPQDKNAVEAVTAAGASSTLPVQGYTVCLNGQAIMELKGASRDHAILKLSTIKDHIQKLLHNSIQSPTDMYDHNTSHLSNSNHSNKSTTKYHSMIELYITVHSTIPNELLSKQEINISKECKLIKGSEGPASKPIHLTASLLILAAGSLETAYKIFGLNLATKLGINENTAKLAGVSLSLDGLQETTTLENNQNVENINSDEDHGLLVVSAENVARKPSPTADALGSAEALLLRRKLEKQELKDNDNDDHDHDHDPHLSPDHNPITEISNYSHTIKPKNNLYQSIWDTSHTQKSPINRYYQYQKSHYPRNNQESKYKLRQARSISDDYEWNLRYGPSKDVYYSDEASLNSSASSESSTAPDNNRWFRTSSSYNLTADYPNRRWKPRGVIRNNIDRGYPHEYHESFTIARLNRREGIRRRHLNHLYDSKMYPLYKSQHFYNLPNHPQSFKSHTYSGRISPENKPTILFKHGSRRLLDQYPYNKHRKHEILPMSSSSNEEKYPDSMLNNRNYFNQMDHFNKIPLPETCLVNTRSRSTSPKRIHKLSGLSHPFRNTEIEYNIGNVPIHRTPKHYRPLPIGIENRRWPIRERYYFGHRNPHENLSLPEIQITRNSSLSDNEPQFQANDQYQQQTRYSYQDFRGPTRPIRSRFMDTRRHGSYDPQMNTANFSTTRHDPDYSRPVVPSDSYTPGPKRPFHFNMPSPASGPIPQHEYRPSFNQVNIKSCRSGDQGSGLRQSVVSQYSRPSKSFIQIEQQYGRNQRNINDDYSSRISHNELKPIQVVVALYDYDPTTMSPNIDGAQEELPFREGQLIKILTECDEDGFYLGECNGLRGLVPSNMVSELQSHSLRSQKINHSIDSHSNLINNNYLSSDQLNIIRSTDMNSPIQNYYYTTRKYDPFISQSNTTPRNTDFINEQVYQQQQQQQQMTIPDYSDIKELHNNELEQEGYSQSQTKYTTEINPNTINQTSNKSMESVQQQQQQQQQQPQQQQQQQQPNQQSKIMIAIYDYDPHVLSPNADIDAELSFRAGELITVYGNMDDDGFYYGETKDGRRGLVPSNFLHSCTNDTNYLNKQKNSSTISTQLSSTNISINHRDQSYSMDPNNSSVRMQSRTNSSQFHNPNSDRTKLMHNNTRPNSPCTQTRLYTTNNSSEVINTNINSTAYHRDELTMNGMERFPENEENPIIVMDLNPISNHSHRKGNSTKDYDTPYIHQHDTDISDNYVASTGPSYNQRRRSTIRSLFKRE